jgi:hypothetical protein
LVGIVIEDLLRTDYSSLGNKRKQGNPGPDLREIEYPTFS